MKHTCNYLFLPLLPLRFNTAIRRFPKNILASLFGFEKRAYFEAAEGAEQAPKVEF